MTFPDTTRPPAPRRFSSSEAAFEGFRLLRDQTSAVLAWAAVYLAFSLVCGFATVSLFGARMMGLAQLQAQGAAASPQAVLSAMAGLAPFYLVFMVATVAFYAVINAAVNRAVLRPREGGFGRLRLGAAELRQAGVMLVIWLVVVATYIALAIALVLGAVVFGLVLHDAPQPAGALLLVAAGIGAFAALIYVLVRVSLLSACTFDVGRIDLGRAWRLTRGRVWPLLGAYVLAWLMMMVVALAFLVLFVATAAIVGGGLAAAGAVLHPDMSSLGAFFGPVQIGYLLLSSILFALYFGVFIGTPANAYLQITGGDADAARVPLERGF